MKTIHLLSAAALALLSLATSPARAAESFDSCGGRYISSLPAIISTQGTWCMTGDLATSITSGNAIEVTTNNVTIDCNNNKLGNLSAGLSSGAIGIRSAKDNVRVINCQVRGFKWGVWISGDEPAIVDNRFDSQTQYGIYTSGNAPLIEGNVVFNIVGTHSFPSGIVVANGGGIIRDNIVNDIYQGGPSLTTLYGIRVVMASDTIIERNTLRNFYPGSGSYVVGIELENLADPIVQDNRMVTVAATGSVGIFCTAVTTALIDNNRTNNFVTSVDEDCTSPTNHIGL